MIRHYAAGARLIGLSEQQIRRHLEQLRRSSMSNNKSPYAQPPYAFMHLCRQKEVPRPVKLEKVAFYFNTLCHFYQSLANKF